MEDDFIAAHQIADFVFCPRCWVEQLGLPKSTTENMIQGSVYHNTLAHSGKRQQRIISFTTRLTWLLLLALIALAFWILK